MSSEINNLIYDVKRNTIKMVYLIADALKQHKYYEALVVTEFVRAQIDTIIRLERLTSNSRTSSAAQRSNFTRSTQRDDYDYGRKRWQQK